MLLLSNLQKQKRHIIVIRTMLRLLKDVNSAQINLEKPWQMRVQQRATPQNLLKNIEDISRRLRAAQTVMRKALIKWARKCLQQERTQRPHQMPWMYLRALLRQDLSHKVWKKFVTCSRKALVML